MCNLNDETCSPCCSGLIHCFIVAAKWFDGDPGCGLIACHFVPEDGQAALLVLELNLVLPRHLRLGIQVHADYVTVSSALYTKGKILQLVRGGTITCIGTVPQTIS